MILSAPFFHFPDILFNKIKPDLRHRSTWNGGIGNADIWLLKNVVCRAPYFHAKGTNKITVLIAFNGINVSNGALFVDLAESVLADDAPSTNHNGEANL